MKWSKSDICILEEDWNLASKDVLLKKLGRTWKSIERKSRALKLKRKRMCYSIDRQFEEVEYDWLIGEMLGDGHFSRPGQYCHTSKYEEYIYFLQQKFVEVNIPAKVWENYSYDKRTHKTYHRFLLKTPCIFKKSRNKWYPFGVKIVPYDVNLNEEIIYHWLLGDGNCKVNSFSLCTMGFSYDNIVLLVAKLNYLEIPVTIQKDNNLYIRKTNQSKCYIKKILTTFNPPKCYQYKFDRLYKWTM